MSTPGTLAKTLFQSGATDEVKVINPEDVKDNKPLNGYVSKVRDGAKGVADFINDNRSLIGESLELARVAREGGYSKKELLDRAGSVLSKVGLGDSLGGLSDKVKNAITNNMPISKETFNNIVTVGKKGMVVYDQVKNVKDVRGALGLLGQYSDDLGLTQIFDINAEIAFITAISDELSEMGFPHLLDVIDDRLNKDTSGKLKHGVYVNIWPTQLETSNLNQINKILDDIGPSKLLGYYPDTVKRLLSSYRAPLDRNKHSFVELRNELLATLNKLDKNWGKYNRVYLVNGTNTQKSEWVWDLDVFSTASGDAYDVLIGDTTYVHPLSVAPQYGHRASIEVMRGTYPKFTFTTPA